MTNHACHAALALLLGALLLLADPGIAAASEVETITCTEPAGFFSPAAAGERIPTAKDGAVVWDYVRGRDEKLVHAVLLAGLEELHLRVQSERAALLGVVIPQRDGAAFFRLVSLSAGEWTPISLGPSDLRPPDGDATCEPDRLGVGYVLVDKSPEPGRNTLRVDKVVVTRSSLPRTKGRTIDADTTLSEPAFLDGPLTITNQARVRITATRFGLGGDVTVKSGTLEVDGSVLEFPQRFPHDRTIRLAPGSELVVRDAVVATGRPATLKPEASTAVLIERTLMQGGFTGALGPGTDVRLNDVTSPGEFILFPGCRFSARASRGVLLWLAAGTDAGDVLVLPKGERIETLSIDRGWQLSVESSTKILWGFVSTTDSHAAIERSALRAVGLHFGGTGSSRVGGLAGGHLPTEGRLAVSDRTLRFAETTVETWNVYTGHRARLVVADSTIGEAIAFDESRLELRDTVCDGTGGYVCARGRSRMRIVGGAIRAPVIARDDSVIVLEGCRVEGDVLATGRSRIELHDCEVAGAVTSEAGAKIIRP